MGLNVVAMLYINVYIFITFLLSVSETLPLLFTFLIFLHRKKILSDVGIFLKLGYGKYWNH